LKTTLKVVLILLLATVLHGTLHIPHNTARVNATLVRIRHVQLALDDLKANYPHEYETLLTNEPNIIRSRLRLLLNRHAQGNPPSEVEMDKMFSDAWEHPLNMCHRPLAIAHNAAPKLLATPGDILVWSNGNDGTNDFGAGDDIIFPK